MLVYYGKLTHLFIVTSLELAITPSISNMLKPTTFTSDVSSPQRIGFLTTRLRQLKDEPLQTLDVEAESVQRFENKEESAANSVATNENPIQVFMLSGKSILLFNPAIGSY